MKKLLILACLILPCALNAQKYFAPDEDQILKQTIDAASPNYYPLLLNRYLAGDHTLGAEEYHYLYYGYAYREEYKPLDPQPAADMILSIIDSTPQPDAAQCAKIIECGKQVMLSDPFSPTNLNMMAYAYSILGDTVSARTNVIRVSRILEAIKSSGSGLSEKYPWVVLSFSHAEDVMRSMGNVPASRRVVSRSVEYIDTGKRGAGVTKGYFFDYSRVYWNRPDQLPDRSRSNGFEINGIKLRSNR